MGNNISEYGYFVQYVNIVYIGRVTRQSGTVVTARTRILQRYKCDDQVFYFNCSGFEPMPYGR